MKARDRMFLTGLVAAALLVGFYLLLVSPERHKASTLGSQLSAAQQQRTDALSQVQAAQAAQTQYPSAYANVVRLGKAVPPSDDTASLVYQLDNTTCANCRVDFQKITAGSSSAPASPAGVAASPAAFAPLPFQFTFTGGFFELYHYFRKVTNYTRINGNRLDVTGRLLSIQGFSVTGQGGALTADISATAYTLPSGQALTGTATPSGPAAVPAANGAGAATQPVSTPSSSPSKSPTPAAVTQVGP